MRLRCPSMRMCGNACGMGLNYWGIPFYNTARFWAFKNFGGVLAIQGLETMLVQLLKSKIHRATVTCANLNYQGSISIDAALCRRANILQWERVDIYNVTNGARLSTYVIYGNPGEITLNGAAARCVQPGDKVIIATYATMTQEEAQSHRPTVILVDDSNQEIPQLP